MRLRLFACGLATTLAVAAPALAQPTAIPLDQTLTVGGVQVACTGIGQTKDDPHWLAFAVRTEYARANGNYLANESLSVTDAHGQPVLSVSCEGPWILLGLPAGVYHLEATSSEPGTTPIHQTATAPSQGQARVIFTFQNAH